MLDFVPYSLAARVFFIIACLRLRDVKAVSWPLNLILSWFSPESCSYGDLHSLIGVTKPM